MLLFPGRHLLNTRFQEDYVVKHAGTFDEIVFAITSANQSHSRYNPIPLEVRAIGVDRFARRLRERGLQAGCRIVPVPHYGPTGRFADFLIKEMCEATEGELQMTPANTIVLSSTETVIGQFEALGFRVLTAELETRNPAKFVALTPIEVLKRVVAGEDVSGLLSPATSSLWRDFPDVLRRVNRLYRDPLLTESGSLTEMRNYSTYAAGMNDRAVLEVKYHDVKAAIVAGRIADEGCADGALLVPIARDFPDSDLIGIEITGEFIARCLERQRAMEYGGTYIHFHQRNITEAIFEPESIDTTLCNSTTHELWSYGQREKTLLPYLAEKFRQTRRGGRLVIRDVVGVENGEREVLLWCDAADGSNADIQKTCASSAALAQHVGGLSTWARFQRFAVDFLADQRKNGERPADSAIRFTEVEHDGKRFYRLRLRDAMEFLLKKDYADNWNSELNEEFCFWSFSRWKQAIAEAGFRVVEGAGMSRAYTSEWIVKHRFEGKVELLGEDGSRLEWPVTNMVLVGEK
jgi:hypothetical protein